MFSRSPNRLNILSITSDVVLEIQVFSDDLVSLANWPDSLLPTKLFVKLVDAKETIWSHSKLLRMLSITNIFGFTDITSSSNWTGRVSWQSCWSPSHTLYYTFEHVINDMSFNNIYINNISWMTVTWSSSSERSPTWINLYKIFFLPIPMTRG